MLNFYEKLNCNYDVILMMYCPGIAQNFHDNMFYDHTKFEIDIISLSKVTGVSCALDIPRSDLLNFYVIFWA